MATRRPNSEEVLGAALYIIHQFGDRPSFPARQLGKNMSSKGTAFAEALDVLGRLGFLNESGGTYYWGGGGYDYIDFRDFSGIIEEINVATLE